MARIERVVTIAELSEPGKAAIAFKFAFVQVDRRRVWAASRVVYRAKDLHRETNAWTFHPEAVNRIRGLTADGQARRDEPAEVVLVYDRQDRVQYVLTLEEFTGALQGPLETSEGLQWFVPLTDWRTVPQQIREPWLVDPIGEVIHVTREPLGLAASHGAEGGGAPEHDEAIERPAEILTRPPAEQREDVPAPPQPPEDWPEERREAWRRRWLERMGVRA